MLILAAILSMLAFTWHDVPADTIHLRPLIWSTPSSNPSAIAIETLTRTNGERAVFMWTSWLRDPHTLIGHPDDVLPGGYDSPWLDAGTVAVKAAWTPWLDAFATAGGDIDILVIDYETQVTNWTLEGQAHLDAIIADPRSAALEAAMGGPQLENVLTSSSAWQAFNYETFKLRTTALEEAIFFPLWNNFPDAEGSNYNDSGTIPSELPVLTWRSPSAGPVTGTHGNVNIYGRDGRGTFAPYESVQLDVERLRSMLRSGSFPVSAWVAYNHWTHEGAPVSLTPHYRELILHTLLHNPDRLFFWNPTTAGTTGSTDADERLLDAIIAAVDVQFGNGSRTPLSLERIDYADDLIVSSMQVGAQTHYRVTTQEADLPVEVYKSGVYQEVLTPDASGEAGVWYTSSPTEQITFQQGPGINPDPDPNPMAWYDTNWLHRSVFTIPAANVPTTVTDAPVYIPLSLMPAGFWTTAQANGADLRVTAGDGVTEWPIEVVAIDTVAQTGEVHTKAPELVGGVDNDVAIYYGNAAALAYADADPFGAHNVWPTTDFGAIYHLAEDPSSGTITDSSGNENHGTMSGAMTGSDLVSGQVGTGLAFDGIDDEIVVPHDASMQFSGTPFELSCWINNADGTESTGFVGNAEFSDGGYTITQVANTGDVTNIINDGTTQYRALNVAPLSVGIWTLVELAFDGTQMHTYTDGVLRGSQAANVTDSGSPFVIGNTTQGGLDNFATATLDEVRIIISVRTDAWRSVQYANQNDPATFFVVGPQEDAPTGVVVQESITLNHSLGTSPPAPVATSGASIILAATHSAAADNTLTIEQALQLAAVMQATPQASTTAAPTLTLAHMQGLAAAAQALADASIPLSWVTAVETQGAAIVVFVALPDGRTFSVEAGTRTDVVEPENRILHITSS